MEVRDASHPDASALAEFADLPVGVAEQLIADRTVRLATDSVGSDGNSPIRGYVAFSASPGTVHITRIAGDPDAVSRLLEEPLRFARTESMAVEVVMPADDPSVSVVRSAGFERVGDGPAFEGAPTHRYRIGPGA